MADLHFSEWLDERLLDVAPQAQQPQVIVQKQRNGCVTALAVVGGIIVLLFVIGVIGALSMGDDSDGNDTPGGGGFFDDVDAADMTLDEFNAISDGMTYAQVVAIVGGEGQVLSESSIAGFHTVMYGWDGAGSLGANANVMFQNDAMQTKAQFGLE